MRKQVWSVILEDVAARGTTVLVSSHNLRELEDVCDHVGVLHEGRMLLERSLSDLQENIVKVQLVTDRPIPPELKEKIFEERFSTKGEERGMGLAIVREIVESVGGTIAVHSDERKTRFEIDIPGQGRQEETI